MSGPSWQEAARILGDDQMKASRLHPVLVLSERGVAAYSRAKLNFDFASFLYTFFRCALRAPPREIVVVVANLSDHNPVSFILPPPVFERGARNMMEEEFENERSGGPGPDGMHDATDKNTLPPSFLLLAFAEMKAGESTMDQDYEMIGRIVAVVAVVQTCKSSRTKI